MTTSNKSCSIYIGGLGSDITREAVHAAFITFGHILSIDLPSPHYSSKSAGNKGYAFVEYEEAQDAHDAIDNMHLSELYGNLIKVNLARNKTNPGKGGDGLNSEAIWSNDEYIQQHILKEPPNPQQPSK